MSNPGQQASRPSGAVDLMDILGSPLLEENLNPVAIQQHQHQAHSDMTAQDAVDDAILDDLDLDF